MKLINGPSSWNTESSYEIRVKPLEISLMNGAHGPYSFLKDYQPAPQSHSLDPALEISSMCSADASDWIKHNLIRHKNRSEMIDARNIGGISSSKSNLAKYSSIFDFGSTLYMNQQENDTRYPKKWPAERLMSTLFQDSFASGGTRVQEYEWSKHLKWNNTDGSHRFAMAYYLGHKFNLPFEFYANVTRYEINWPLINNLQSIYDLYVFAVESGDEYILFDLFKIHSSRHQLALLSSTPKRNLGALGSREKTMNMMLLVDRKQELSRPVKNWLDKNMEGENYDIQHALN